MVLVGGRRGTWRRSVIITRPRPFYFLLRVWAVSKSRTTVVAGKGGGGGGREVTERPGHPGLDLEIGGLDDKPVNAAAGVDEVVGAATVSDVDEAGAGGERAEGVVGGDNSPVGPDDRAAPDQLSSD